MATVLAPFTNSMKLGSGFNSFTQELCIDNAVVRGEEITNAAEGGVIQDVAQSVTYKTSVVEKATDVAEAMNINAAFNIKYDNIKADGKGGLGNTNTLKSSDLIYMVSVKVVNQIIMDHSLTKFSPVNGLKADSFTKVYGDSFISGFQEGGEFTAVIAIKILDRDRLDEIKADATLAMTKNKFDGTATGKFEKTARDVLSENETTVTVTWTGGGQDLKKPETPWTYDSMLAAALKFPSLVAKTPMRTHAVLTRYTALKSFYSHGPQYSPLNYEHAGNYTAALQEAYLDYKNIAKDIQVLAFEVANGAQSLVSNSSVAGKQIAENGAKASKPALLAEMTNQASPAGADKPEAAGHASSDDDSFTAIKAPGGSLDKKDGTASVQPLIIEAPYPATIFGLEAARVHVRFMMNRIVAEVDKVTAQPDIATDEFRSMPYMSPFLFKQLLPIPTPKVVTLA